MDLVAWQAMVLGAAAAVNLAHGALTGLVAGQIHRRVSWRWAALFVAWSALSFGAGRWMQWLLA